MICHVVLIRLKEVEKTSWVLEQARDVLGSVPGVKNLRVGTGIKSDYSYPIAFVMDFDDEVVLEAYQIHPEHVMFRDELLDHPEVRRRAVEVLQVPIVNPRAGRDQPKLASPAHVLQLVAPDSTLIHVQHKQPVVIAVQRAGEREHAARTGQRLALCQGRRQQGSRGSRPEGGGDNRQQDRDDPACRRAGSPRRGAGMPTC